MRECVLSDTVPMDEEEAPRGTGMLHRRANPGASIRNKQRSRKRLLGWTAPSSQKVSSKTSGAVSTASGAEP